MFAFPFAPLTNFSSSSTVRKRSAPPPPPAPSALRNSFFGLHSRSKRAKQLTRAPTSAPAPAPVLRLPSPPLLPTPSCNNPSRAQVSPAVPPTSPPRLGICSVPFLTAYGSVVAELSQRYNIRLSDSELLGPSDSAAPLVEFNHSTAAIIVDPSLTSIAAATAGIIKLRTLRRYSRLFIVIRVDDARSLPALQSDLAALHNSVGDSRNGDYVNVAYSNGASMARFLSGAWELGGGGRNELIEKFPAEEWSGSDKIEYLRELAGALSVTGAMEILDRFRGEGGEVSMDGVWRGMCGGGGGGGRGEEGEEGGGGGGERLVGLELAGRQLRTVEWK